MAVYVDSALITCGRMKMSHMVADTVGELHAMADHIGLKREWFQVSNGGIPHYDVSASHRVKAIANGARAIDKRGMIVFIKRFRSTP